MERHRSEVLKNELRDWRCDESYTNGRGTCTSVPGAPLVLSNSSGNYVSSSHTREMTDVETPDYHKKSRQGMIICSPMESKEVIEERTRATYYRSCISEKYGCTPNKWYDYIDYEGAGTIDLYSFIESSGVEPYLPSGIQEEELSSLRDQAVSQAWANISQADVLSYVALLEIGKSVSGMKTLLKSAHKMMRAGRMKVHRFEKMGRGLTRAELSDFYMNLRYNLRPLYYDVVGCQRAIAQKDTSARRTYRGSAYEAEDIHDVVSVGEISSGLPYMSQYTDFSRFCKTDIEVHAGVLVNWDRNDLSSRLGGMSFASSAYDLVPYSFIVDWFANVGDTLLAWMPIVGGTALTSWVSSVETTVQTSMIGYSHTDISSQSSSYRYRHWKYLYDGELSRTTIKKTRIPRPERTMIPSFTVNLNALKLLDLGVIVKNLFNEKHAIRKYRI